MWFLPRGIRRFARRERGGAIIEFALVIPIFFLVVWGIITFSRAYQRLNTLTNALREGARWASTRPFPYTTAREDSAKAQVFNYSVAYGFQIDTSRVVVDESSGYDVHVRVTNYPLFSGLNFLGGLQSINVTRDVVFRLEGS